MDEREKEYVDKRSLSQYLITKKGVQKSRSFRKVFESKKTRKKEKRRLSEKERKRKRKIL